MLDRELCTSYAGLVSSVRLAASTRLYTWEEVLRALEGVLMSCVTEENGLSGYLGGRVSHRHSPLGSSTNPLLGRRPGSLLPTNNPPRRSYQAPSEHRCRIALRDALIPARPFLVHWAGIAVPRLRSPTSLFQGGRRATGVSCKQTSGQRVSTVRTQAGTDIPLSAGANSVGFRIYACTTVNKVDTPCKPLLAFGSLPFANPKMNELPKTSHPYTRLGISRGDLQWIEVKRPLPKHGCPPSSLRNASPPTELVLSTPQREPRNTPTSFSGPAPLQRHHSWAPVAHKSITLITAVPLTGQRFPTRLFGRSTWKLIAQEIRPQSDGREHDRSCVQRAGLGRINPILPGASPCMVSIFTPSPHQARTP
jgi:hypothetical protein